jgi:[amino group carrier protein]-6-phospho-L-2-aminoadipate/5-phospho-L-glutamate reductase
MNDAIRVAIAGGSGYGGAESLRWLAEHPAFEVVAVTSRSHAGKSVADVHPNLAGFFESLRFTAGADDVVAAKPDAAILALPHKEAAAQARRLAGSLPSLRIVDLSGDHRLADPKQYEASYGAAHPHPEELTGGAWVYGIPEAHRDAIRKARRVANPGCFATGAVLAVLPLARRGLVAGPVRHVAITGSSGSGAEATAGTHHPERVENVRAYKVLEHQHVPEIVRCTGVTQPWLMVPQSGPFARGIFTSVFVDLPREMTTADVRAVFAEEYGDDPFVRLRADTPQVAHVRNTNFCDVAVKASGRSAVVMTAIDNLGKGMVTQAIQNLNLMFGLEETAGLRRPGGRP